MLRSKILWMVEVHSQGSRSTMRSYPHDWSPSAADDVSEWGSECDERGNCRRGPSAFFISLTKVLEDDSGEDSRKLGAGNLIGIHMTYGKAEGVRTLKMRSKYNGYFSSKKYCPKVYPPTR